MTKEEIEELHVQLDELEEESRRKIYAQLDLLASDSEMDDAQRDALYAEIRQQIAYLRQAHEILKSKLQKTNAAVDEIETRLAEQEKLNKRREKKGIHILPLAPTNAEIDYQEKKRRHFAQGITFYKLFWVFFIGCFAGVVLETLYCLIQRGHYESRVGLIYGPFNLVYGIGALALTGALYRFRNRGRVFSFVGGFIVGTVIEYACSWFQETFFGSTSWDYSNMPFNLNGRVCLLYSLFWGILGILWIKDLYPRMAQGILKIPNRMGRGMTWVLLVFMVFNSAMTGLTALRWMHRREGAPAQNAFEEYLDANYPDERMQKIFANAEFNEDKEARILAEQEKQDNFKRIEETGLEIGREAIDKIQSIVGTFGEEPKNSDKQQEGIKAQTE